jgi:hypothetical protein
LIGAAPIPRSQTHARSLRTAQEGKAHDAVRQRGGDDRVALRGKGRIFSYFAEEIGVCCDVIGREMWARGIDPSPV